MIQQPKFKSSNNIKGNLFVKNIPDNFDNKALMDMFSTYGNILSCKVSFNKETASPCTTATSTSATPPWRRRCWRT